MEKYKRVNFLSCTKKVNNVRFIIELTKISTRLIRLFWVDNKLTSSIFIFFGIFLTITQGQAMIFVRGPHWLLICVLWTKFNPIMPVNSLKMTFAGRMWPPRALTCSKMCNKIPHPSHVQL